MLGLDVSTNSCLTSNAQMLRCRGVLFNFEFWGGEQNFKKVRKTRRKKEKTTIQKRYHMVVPYTKGLCESYKSICGKYGVQSILQRRKHTEEHFDVSKGQR